MENIKSIEELQSLLKAQMEQKENNTPDNSTTTTPVVETPVEATNTPVVDTPTETVKQVNETSETTKQPKITAQKLLETVSVDLSSINIIRSDNPLGIHQELNSIFLKPSYEVIALQSGYRVSMKALNNDDMIKVRKFTGTEREQNMKLFNFVYRNMENLSVGRIDFNTWLNITAEADFETLTYGLFCATFPHETDYSVRCGECGHINNVKISKESLIRAVNAEETGEYVRTILSNNYDAKEIVKHSLVNYTKRIILPESKTIIDLHTPTLKNYVDSLTNAERFKSAYEPELFGYLKHIKDVFIPHLNSIATGKVSYIQIETIEDKLTVINKISKVDREALEKELAEKANKYKVEYKLPDITCAGCGAPIKNIVVDVTEVLFQNIVRAF
jgi:hypothetical protein